MSGIDAARDNVIGVVGMAPGARLWALKVCNSNGDCSDSQIFAALDYARPNARDKVEVVNIRLVGSTSPSLDTVARNTIYGGMTVVVSAGNDNMDTDKQSPSRVAEAITVSAIADSDGVCGRKGIATWAGPDDTLASFSNMVGILYCIRPRGMVTKR